MSIQDLSWVVAGEGAVLIYFAQQPSDETLERIQQFRAVLESHQFEWLVDSIPSFTSLLIEYDPMQIDYFAVTKVIKGIANEITINLGRGSSTKSPIELPVYYSEQTGPDLASVASMTKMSVDNVIQYHLNMTYRVHAIGFAPGFTYLGTLHEALVLPRLKTPRLKVPKGSVAIAEQQTAIYPQQSPGGWHILGNCPLPLFDPMKVSPMRFGIGDRVKFKSISKQEFIELGGVLS
jgi:KipI family sensor histidine kinase inhibitor